MAAAAQKTYTTNFTIGARVLASFKTAMARTQAGFRAINASAMKAGSSIVGFTKKIGGLLGIFGAYAGTRVLEDLFHNSTKAAEEMHQRVRRLNAGLGELPKIAAGGPKVLKEQSDLILQHNEMLEKTGVIHHSILDSMAGELAVKGGFPPQQIMDSLDVLQRVLVVHKGVNATMQDGVDLAESFAKAAKTGMVRGLFMQDLPLQKEVLATIRNKHSEESRYQALMAHFGTMYPDIIGKARKSDEGRIHLLSNALETMREDIGNKLLPTSARLADSWRAALPAAKPILEDILQGIVDSVIALADYITNTLIPAWKQWKEFYRVSVTPVLDKVREQFNYMVDKIGPEFRNMLERITGKSKDFKGTLGDLLLATLKKVGDSFKWVGDHAKDLVPLIVTLTGAFIALDVVMGIASLINPVSEVILGVSALSYGVYELHQHLGDLQKREDIWGRMARGLKTFDDAIKPSVDKIKANFVQGWVDLWENLKKGWSGFAYYISGAGQMELVNKAWVNIKEQLHKLFLEPIDEIKKSWDEMVKSFTHPIAMPDFIKWLDIWRGATPAPKGGMKPPTANTFPGLATGGIITRPSIRQIAERGPEAVIPLSSGPRAEGLLDYANRAMGRGGAKVTQVNFQPRITITGNAGPETVAAMDTSLRRLTKDFIKQFGMAQDQERRLSYESGYG